MKGATGHGLVLGADQQGTAAGEGFQQIHSPLRHLAIGGDHHASGAQLLRQGAQDGGAARREGISKGGSRCRQQVLDLLHPFIQNDYPPPSGLSCDLQARRWTPGIQAGGHTLQTFIGARDGLPWDADSLCL
jgi:hypothetical protein